MAIRVGKLVPLEIGAVFERPGKLETVVLEDLVRRIGLPTKSPH